MAMSRLKILIGHKNPPPRADYITIFNEMRDTCDIDALIQAINKLYMSKLNPASTSSPDTPSGSTNLEPVISRGATFLKSVNEHIEQMNRMDKVSSSGQSQKVAEEILQQLGHLHWMVGGLSIIAYLLNKVGKVSENKSECLQLLKEMIDLADHIKKLRGQIPEEEEKLRKAFLLIIECCVTCASQLQSEKLFRFLKSSVNSQTLTKLSSKITRLYRDLTLTIAIDIKKVQPINLPVLYPKYPEGAVGLEKSLEELKKKHDLQTRDGSSRAVVIYGVGGIGKTTLANALVATIAEDLQHLKYNYTKVEIYEDTLKNDLKSMQQQILRDCFPNYEFGREILTRNCGEGRDHITAAFNCGPEYPVFIFIDNARRSNDLEELLPSSGFPQGSRILVTTRNLAVTDFFEDLGIPRFPYAVHSLDKEHSLKILCKDSTHLDQIGNNNVEKITRIAGGIPLVLKVIGARLKKQKYKVENCSQILQALEDGEDVKEENLSERLVHSVYKDLEPSTQEAFLDICSFFDGWPRRHVEYIVGVEEVTSLVEATLVTSLPFVNSVDELYYNNNLIDLAGEDKLIVHDIIQAKGRSMGKSTRIQDFESLSRAAKYQVQVIKGVELHSDKDIIIEDSQLSCISDSLRILILGEDGMRISAPSNQTFKELRYLLIGRNNPCFLRNLNGLSRLSVYDGPILEEGLSKLPQNLKYLKVIGVFSSNVDESPRLKESKFIPAIENSSLEELDLSGVSMQVMLDGRLHFDSLKILSLRRWEHMEELPSQVCGLPSLNKLTIEECWSLKRLPESIAHLKSLTHLKLRRCHSLEEVCSSLGDLSGLRYIDLSECSKLIKLPDNFGQLSALEYLSLEFCRMLKELPENFAQLRSLKGLNLNWCWDLKQVPSNFVQLPSLEVLWIEGAVGKLLAGSGQIHNNWKVVK